MTLGLHINTTTTSRAGGGARRELMIDRTATMRVSRSAHATYSSSLLFFFPSAPVYGPMLRKRLHSKSSLFFQTPESHFPARLYAPIVTAPSLNLPACTSNFCAKRPGTRFYFYLIHCSFPNREWTGVLDSGFGV